MDLVYVCRKGENEELRYSIRSAVENFPHDRVWLVGHKPDWYSGPFIPVEDVGTKFNNIRLCLKMIAYSYKISNDFVLMNDDFFFVKKIEELPVMHGGSLYDRVEHYKKITPGSSYTLLLANTYKALLRRGIKEPIDYDMHVPMKMSKDELSKVVDKPFLVRSMYGNEFEIGGELIKDVKTYSSPAFAERNYDYSTGDSSFISTEDGTFSKVLESVLKDMFPSPSEYELK